MRPINSSYSKKKLAMRVGIFLSAPVLLLLLFLSGFFAESFLTRGESPAWAVGMAFVDGDANGDGTLDIADPLHLLDFLFLGGPPPVRTCPSSNPVSTVIVIRHAEKDLGVDPGLTDEGKIRAEHLAKMFDQARVDFLIASEFRRTQETLKPLADLKQLPIEKIAEAEDVVRRLENLPPGSVAVVAHHSFTIHPILHGLGIEDTSAINIGGNNYDNFLVVMEPSGLAPQLLHLKYGS